jgi:hypothetical protein
MEKYFELLEHKKAIDFCRFTTTNHKLSIEQSRWDNIDSNNRISSWRFLINNIKERSNGEINYIYLYSQQTIYIGIEKYILVSIYNLYNNSK